jgi:SAM-dependent methyltransferase
MPSTSTRSVFKQTSIYRVLRYLTDPLRIGLKIRRRLLKYGHLAYDKTFDWNWKQTHFNRIALVNLLVSAKRDCAYLEIGCAANDLYDSVPVRNKTGVDPSSGGNARMTSDDFFRQNKSRFDVIFIDGLHTYDQVRRDIINSIKVLKPGGWIAFHDMLPRSWMEHNVPYLGIGPWTGDVWKVAFELIRTEGIDFRILKIDCGIGVVSLTGDMPDLIDLTAELSDKSFSYFYERISELPIVEWNDAQVWLRSSGSAGS